MSTRTDIDEIAEGILRLSSYLPEGPPGGITFNQFLVLGEEPLLFHTGPRGLFLSVRDAAASVIDLETLRWISSGHASRPDEYGALSQWEAVAPVAQVAHGHAGCFLCLYDMTFRGLRPLADGEVLDVDGHQLRWVDTPHVPGPWEAGVLFDEPTGTLFCGDLFARTGPTPATTSDDVVNAAIATDQLIHNNAHTPQAGPTLRRLAQLAPQRLALMHGPTFVGDGAGQLLALADYFDAQLQPVP